MDRTTGFRLFLLAGCCALPAAPALADEETQVWLTEGVAFAPATGWTAQADFAQRFRQGPDQYVLRANADRKVADWLRLGFGTQYNWVRGQHEWRPHQQATLGFGALSLRTRLEERFVSGGARTGWRLRNRLQASLPLGPGLSGQASGELFYNLRSTKPGANGKVEQYRFVAGLTQKLGPALDGNLSYTHIVQKRPGADHVIHAPGASISLRF